MKKRGTGLFLALCIFAGMLTALPMTASAAASGVCGDNLTWVLDDAGTLTISGTGDMWDWQRILTGGDTPWSDSGNIVKTVIIQDGVTSIGRNAFCGCGGLTSIKIPDGITSVGDFTFANCSSLESVDIPGTVTEIGEAAFYGCSSLTSVSIPNRVTNIGGFVFGSCSKLTDVNISSSVMEIGYRAFADCNSLTNINIDEKNTKYSSLDGNLYNKDRTKLIQYAIGKDAPAFSVPDSVIEIGEHAFADCSSLENVNIPDGVTGIGYYAFNDCGKLKSVNIPGRLTEIESGLFSHCNSLASISIPDGITKIDEMAFLGCGLESISIPNSVTYIADYAFRECGSLTNISFSDSVTRIGDGAFYGCGMESVYLPRSVTYIGGLSFSGCSGLKSIDVNEENTKYISVDGDLYNKDRTELVQYAAGKDAASFSLPDGIESIGDGAFQKSKLRSISIPGSVTFIGSWAFSDCSSLTDIDIPDSVTRIGTGAFSGCGGLTAITVTGSMTDIGDGAFSFCDSLQSINVDEGNTKYISVDGNLYKKDRTELIQYAIGKTDEVFSIPSGVEYIGCYAFAGCDKLTEVSMPDGVTVIDSGAFENCSGLTSVTVPRSVMDIRDNAFCDCGSLKNVYYSGNRGQWQDIDVWEYNECLANANIIFNYDGAPARIDAFNCRYGNNTLIAEVKFGYVTQAGRLYIAVYDAGRLVMLSGTAVTVNDSEKVIELAADENYRNYSVKAFLWDNECRLKPLSATAASNIS